MVTLNDKREPVGDGGRSVVKPECEACMKSADTYSLGGEEAAPLGAIPSQASNALHRKFRVLICRQLAMPVKPQRMIEMKGSADRAAHGVGEGRIAVRSYRQHAIKVATPHGKPAI